MRTVQQQDRATARTDWLVHASRADRARVERTIVRVVRRKELVELAARWVIARARITDDAGALVVWECDRLREYRLKSTLSVAVGHGRIVRARRPLRNSIRAATEPGGEQFRGQPLFPLSGPHLYRGVSIMGYANAVADLQARLDAMMREVANLKGSHVKSS
ncbi:MAG: hypothetical protein SGJ09_02210 [Phycisphaerae bacterium]|nr:hypothetical protein [Phycisphaerae bacterium]